MTVTRIGDFFDKTGATERRFFQLTGSASYTTGGESLPPEQLALGRLDKFVGPWMTNGTVIIAVLYDYTNKKVKAFDMAGAEIANGTDLSTYTGRFEVIGR